VVPAGAFAEIEPGKDDEDAERDDLLNNFQLERGEFAVADAVCWNLKTVFGKCNQPTHNDSGEQRGFPVSQVTVPGHRHEDVRANEEQDGFHKFRMLSRMTDAINHREHPSTSLRAGSGTQRKPWIHALAEVNDWSSGRIVPEN